MNRSAVQICLGPQNFKTNIMSEFKKYLGVKEVFSYPMNLGEYNEFRGWQIPKNEDPNREGYLVRYSDEYVSWSPKEVFEEAYRTIDGLTFGQAIEALKQGKLVARKGWNGKGMFLFMLPADKLSVETIVNFVKSLPGALKSHYKAKFSWTQNEATDGCGPDKELVEFTAYICMKAADGSIVNGWLASQTDILAEDWVIVG